MVNFIDTNLFKKILKASNKLITSSTQDNHFIHLFTEDGHLYVHAITYSNDLYLKVCEYGYELDVIVDYKKLSDSVSLMENNIIIKESRDNEKLLIHDSKASVKLHKYSADGYATIRNREAKIINVNENGETFNKTNFHKITSYLMNGIPKSFSESLMDSVFYDSERSYIYSNQYIVRMLFETTQKFALDKINTSIILTILETYPIEEFKFLVTESKIEMVSDYSYYVIKDNSNVIKSVESVANIFDAEITLDFKLEDVSRFTKIANVFIDKESDSDLLIKVEDNKCYFSSDTDLDISNCVITLPNETDDCSFTVNSRDFLKVIDGLKAFEISDIKFELDLSNDCGKIVHDLGDIFISITEV